MKLSYQNIFTIAKTLAVIWGISLMICIKCCYRGAAVQGRVRSVAPRQDNHAIYGLGVFAACWSQDKCDSSKEFHNHYFSLLNLHS